LKGPEKRIANWE